MYLSLFPIVVLVASVTALNVETSSKQTCRTALHTKQGSGDTTTKSTTLYLTRTIKSTITPTKSIIPASATVTKKATVTISTTKTLPQTTDTFSKTLSITKTSTVSTTVVSTTTSTALATVTSTYATSTIAASAGFVPLSSALALDGHAASKKHRRNYQGVARDVAPIEKRKVSQQILCGSDGKVTFNPPQYSDSVTCYKRVKVVTTSVVTVTGTKTKTITAPQGTSTKVQCTSSVSFNRQANTPQTSYTTKTTTLTSTPIAASTTLTFSATATQTTTTTLSSTSTLFTTSTTTTYAPHPTFYAACGPSNAVSFVDNKRINNIATFDPANGFSFGKSSTTAYECCVQCVQSGDCGGTTFHPASGTCYFLPWGGETCNADVESGTFNVTEGTNVGFVVGNSNCGEVVLA